MGGGNANGIALPGSVNFRQNHHIRFFQLTDKIVKQGAGTGIGVGLERQHQPFIRHGIAHGGDGRCQLVGMVGVIVVHIRAVEFSLEFHAPSRAVEGFQSVRYSFAGNSHHPGCSCGCHHDHHGHHHADEVFQNIGVETPRKFEEAAIRTALEQLDDEKKYGSILRAKGILPLTDGKWLHFDYVPGESDVRYGSADYTGRLCVIGTQINEAALKELFGL